MTSASPLPPELNPPLRTLLGPGPSTVHPRVYQAMMAPILGHLDPDFLRIMDETKDLLRAAFRTQNEHTIAVSGTGAACPCAARTQRTTPAPARARRRAK